MPGRARAAALAAIVDAVTDDKFELYNSTWREERPVLSRDDFRRRLALSSVVVSGTRTMAYFACDDLFADHVIEVRMSPDGQISEICLSRRLRVSRDRERADRRIVNAKIGAS